MKKGGNIIDQGAAILSRTWKRIAGIEAIHTVLAIIIAVVGFIAFSAVALTLFFGNLFTSTSEHPIEMLQEIPTETSLGIVGLLIVFGILFTIIAVVTELAKIMVLTKNTSFMESLKFGIKNIGKGFLILMGKNLLILAVTMGLSVSGFILASNILSPGEAFVIATFLTIPGMILAIRLFFVLFTWVDNQQLRAWPVIKQSFALTRGVVFWMIVLLWIVFSVATSMIGGILQIAGGVGTLLQIVVIILAITPALWAMQYAIYEYAKKRNTPTTKTTKKK